MNIIFILNVLQICVFYIFADDVIFQFQRLNAIKQFIKRNQISVFNIIAKTNIQIFDEFGWIKQKPDLTAVVHDVEYRWLNGLVKGILKKISRIMIWVKCYFSLFCSGKGCFPSSFLSRYSFKWLMTSYINIEWCF